MIRFDCICHEPLEVPAELAGDEVQCPVCGRLTDVPHLEDLDKLDADGFKLGDEVAELAPVAKLDYAMVGDRRNDLDHFLAAGATEAGEPRTRPRYDPETHERIKPLEVAEDRPIVRQAIPVEPDDAGPPAARQGGVEYAGPRKEGRIVVGPDVVPWTMKRLPMALFSPTDAFVMFVVFCAQFGLVLMLSLPMWLALMVGVGTILLTVLVLGHYGAVVEDVGYEARDGLPTPLRELRFYEDIWKPFTDFAGSMLLCFALPAVVAVWVAPDAWEAAAMVAAPLPGLAVWPAVLLTMSTSGTLINLWPGRVLAVMAAGGGAYWVAVILGTLGLLSTAGGMGLFILGGSTGLGGLGTLLPGPLPINERVLLSLALPLLCAGTYFMHWYTAHLGLLYRTGHSRFGWYGQAHVRRPRTDPMSQLERMAREKRREERRSHADEAMRQRGGVA
jgi:hypothetical protein